MKIVALSPAAFFLSADKTREERGERGERKEREARGERKEREARGKRRTLCRTRLFLFQF
jgi:hypothetical protein